MKRFYSVKEASNLLGVSTNTVYKYLEEGKVQSRRIGKGRIKIPYKQLEPYISQDLSYLKKGGGRRKLSTQTKEGVAGGDERESDTISPGNRDIIFFSLFKALLLLGLGVIYFAINLSSYFNVGFIDKDLGNFLFNLFPIALIIGGLVVLVGLLFDHKIAEISVWSHAFLALVLGYYSFIALASENYGLFVWTGSFLAVVISHYVRGLGKFHKEINFSSEFLKYSLFLAIIGGVVVTVYPSTFPIKFIANLMSESRAVAAFVWFALYIPCLVYFMSPSGRNSKIRIPFFIINGLFAIWIATELTSNSTWDVSYFSFLTGITALSIGGWLFANIRIELKRMYYVVAAFLWIVTIVLFGLFSIQMSQKRIKTDIKISMQESLNQKVADINNSFERQKAAIISAAADDHLSNILINNNEEAATVKAREIYDKLNNVEAVVIYDGGGIALGVYPRNSLIQGTDFSSREYFQKTKTTYKGYISNVFMGVVGETTVIQTEPIFVGNKFTGMIGVASTLDNLSYQFQINNVGPDYLVHVVDENGVYVYSKDSEKVGEKADILDLLPRRDPVLNEILVSKQTAFVPRWDIYFQAPVAPMLERISNFSIFVAVLIVANSVISLSAAFVLASKKEKVVKRRSMPGFLEGPVSHNLPVTSI